MEDLNFHANLFGALSWIVPGLIAVFVVGMALMFRAERTATHPPTTYYWPDTRVDAAAWKQAQSEMGKHATVSQLALRAQEIKDQMKGAL
jgi:hypothetical protein